MGLARSGQFGPDLRPARSELLERRSRHQDFHKFSGACSMYSGTKSLDLGLGIRLRRCDVYVPPYAQKLRLLRSMGLRAGP